MEICFHYSDCEGQKNLLNALTSIAFGYDEIVIVCVGTDRVSGDSLGPMIGTLLLEECRHVNVYGTLHSPVHAQNLAETIIQVNQAHPGAFIIAVDACLGRAANIEKISFSRKPLKPGTGVSKDLPEVGQVNIQGIVNVGGFMPHLVIQNTRMNTIYNMARVIAGTLAQTVIAHRNFYQVFRLKRA
ncbi:MAG: spore protease YyaC [Firmicutes bacterium HGW-Firmicutes-14]|jgi:putative sporulation protein YyaC|nr:MAG: spore protease YyaC [Firmicutes bacterium HGW-Firmicutes-14]